MSEEKATEQKQCALEPHELAGELTHEQRLKLAEGLVALFHRKEAEDAANISRGREGQRLGPRRPRHEAGARQRPLLRHGRRQG